MKKAKRKSAAKAVKTAAKAPKARDIEGHSQLQVAKHLDIVQQRVGQFVAEGVFKKLRNGRLDLDACRIAYIRWLRDERKASTKSAAASRVQDARAREIELRTAREEGRVYDAETVEAVFVDVLGTLRSEFGGVPAASTRDLDLRGKIEKQLNGAIDRCRDRFEEAGRALQAGREVLLDGEEAVA